MTLIVDPNAVDGFANQIGRAGDNVWDTRNYFNRYAEAGTGGEAFSLAKASHEHAVEIIDSTLNRLACLLDASAPELHAGAGYYRASDLAVADRLDRALPPAGNRCVTALELELASNPCAPAHFIDPRDVRSHLSPPPEPDNPFNALGWMDYLSPSSWANSAFDASTRSGRSRNASSVTGKPWQPWPRSSAISVARCTIWRTTCNPAPAPSTRSGRASPAKQLPILHHHRQRCS
ncbi:hypothetical protein [Micromonospora zhanjiangensis]|uniref:Uncharacterized protein n=1 Tax=Micromonospora zhanjiangensis TaxID=1522057 RepID=A0ABV8KP88_9ACTN